MVVLPLFDYNIKQQRIIGVNRKSYPQGRSPLRVTYRIDEDA